jgi:hypothetical protein
VFVTVIHIQPSLMLGGKAEAYQSEAPYGTELLCQDILDYGECDIYSSLIFADKTGAYYSGAFAGLYSDACKY